MKINDAGLNLIEHFESCKLIPYRDPNDDWTVGWGHLIGQHESELMDGITQDEADTLLESDLQWAEKIVNDYVQQTLNENQFAALVSFVFNVGAGRIGVKSGFVRLKNGQTSTMLRALNAGQFLAAANEFGKWVHLANTEESNGLIARRAAERALFLTPVLAVHNNDI
jgi:lysozyme